MDDDTDHGSSGFDCASGFFAGGFDFTGGAGPLGAGRARNDGRCGHAPPPTAERLRANRGGHWSHPPAP